MPQCCASCCLICFVQVLLSRYAREDDVVVGTECASRERAELEGVVGSLANQLALRTDLSGESWGRQDPVHSCGCIALLWDRHMGLP